MVHLTYTETYDLSTRVGKLGLIGVHTPTLKNLKKLFGGLLMNHKFIRVSGCDIVAACASALPADPLQVGTEAGSVAPQDMFNPILYTAVSNDSFSTILNRLYASSITKRGESVTDCDVAPTGNVKGLSDGANGIAEYTFLRDNSEIANEQIYYELLSDTRGWKKAMPQQGFSMNGLYPIVHTTYSTYGNFGVSDAKGPTNGIPIIGADGSETFGTPGNTVFPIGNNVIKGNPVRLPRLPLHAYPVDDVDVAGYAGSSIQISVMAAKPDGTENANIDWTGVPDNVVPSTYVAAICLPPAKLHRFFYRMRICWHFDLEGVIPITEYSYFNYAAESGANLYTSDYAQQSKVMDNKGESVDTGGIDMEMIMSS